MKEKEILLFSIVELSEKGWKYSESGNVIYIGNSRFPTMTFRADLAHLLGKKYIYEGVYEPRFKTLKFAEITDHTGTYNIPEFLIKTKLPKINKAELKIKNGTASFNGYQFDFSCGLSNLKIKEAVRLANWVLKIEKDL